MNRMTGWHFLTPLSALASGITVGANRERIANEDLCGATHTEVLILKFGGCGYLILDSAMCERAISQLKDE
ncbi:hypothetical protein K432DRAFT_458818, partial [Lepidopterella palustris CBS 459.81]